MDFEEDFGDARELVVARDLGMRKNRFAYRPKRCFPNVGPAAAPNVAGLPSGESAAVGEDTLEQKAEGHRESRSEALAIRATGVGAGARWSPRPGFPTSAVR